ncbi:MAG TPA: hypothetical protein VLN44_01310, partial [Pyrinomonadaceae bacterium]|nr:hypothetical protein [Pyrinomonadaceae bacterium]
MKLLILLALVLSLWEGTVNATLQTRPASPALVLQPCNVPRIAGKAQCGNLEVFENRATRKGRKIS